MKPGDLIHVAPYNDPTHTCFCACVRFEKRYVYARVLIRITDLGATMRGRNNFEARFKYSKVAHVFKDRVTKWCLDI